MSKYYIRRDTNGGLWLFDEKPVKGEDGFWVDKNGCYGKLIRQNLFPEVHSEDEEPKILTIESDDSKRT